MLVTINNGGAVKKLLSLLLLLGVLSGCASVPMASLSEDTQAKKFEPVQGKSSVYVYRNESFGAAIKVTVAADDKMLGQTAPYTYYLLHLEPGAHKFSCYAENTENFSITTKPDQLYFIRQEMKMGMWAARCAIYEAPAEEGKAAVLESNMAQKNQ
jgi:hypothetical protein